MALHVQTHQTDLPVHQDLWLHITNQKMFKAWVYIHGGSASVSALNSLLSSFLPLSDWLWSSSLVSLSSSIKGLRKVLPINPIWAPATVDADTFSLSGEEYVSLVCIKNWSLHLLVFCKMLYLWHQEKSSPRKKNAMCKSCVINLCISDHIFTLWMQK